MVGAPAAEGSIPAWAGETVEYLWRCRQCGVYPRVGGGNGVGQDDSALGEGLSPRGRGKPGNRPAHCRHLRSIPAWAGETDIVGIVESGCKVYPRVGGGNGTISTTGTGIDGLSPRGRGKLRYLLGGNAGPGSIPAWAGETWPCRTGYPCQRVYPRVGGRNGEPLPVAGLRQGLSPRGRGKLESRICRGPKPGSIPAWAGETSSPVQTWQSQRVYPRVGGGNGAALWNRSDIEGLSPRGRGKRYSRRHTPG